MLNREKHQLIMGRILRDVYADVAIAPLLGFKGGTCAYLLHGLPRFSVDLDFDLLSAEAGVAEMVHQRLQPILAGHGEVKDRYLKRYTIFALVSYGDADHNIKVEINTRQLLPNSRQRYELRELLGISLLAAKTDYLFAGKLVALTARPELAMRDVYDIHYFAQANWDIDHELVQARTGKSVKEHLTDCVKVIERIKDSQILQGLGELLDEKEKLWVKQRLKAETIFLLQNYASALQG